MDLSGQQRKKIQKALIDAFPDKASLERMLAFELDKNLDEIVTDSNLENIVFNLIKTAIAENWVEDLIRAGRKSNPSNLSLRNIAGELLGASAEIPLKQQEKNRRDLLEEVDREITVRLESSLHNAVWINLRKESQPQQVKRPWDAEIKIGAKPPESVPNSTTTLEIFDRKDIAGRLLILGQPGAGKTTTLLELAQSLVKRAFEQRDYPIPVLLNLSSWKDERQKLIEWLLIELKSKYGVPKKIGQEWLQNRQLLPLLDGLDEVKQILQESCINSINQFLQEEYRPHHVVICSRIEEYNNFETQLFLNGAIYLQPLTNNQIYDYLNEVNCTELRQTINNDSSLLELIRKPLLLSVSIFAFQEISIDNWQQLSSTTDRMEYLLDAYVIRMLKRDIKSKAYEQKKLPNNKQTRLWLVYLAQQLQRESKTEFLIEEIQPYWLVNQSQKQIYKLISLLSILLIYGLINGLTYGLIYGIIYQLIYGLTYEQNGLFGLFVSVLLAMIAGLTQWEIKLKDKITFKKTIKKKIFDNLINGLKLGLYLVILLVLVVIIVNYYTRFSEFQSSIEGLQITQMYFLLVLSGLILGLLFGLLGLSFGLIRVETDIDLETKKTPNQGIYKSAINGLIYVLITGLMTWLTIQVIYWLALGLYWLITALDNDPKTALDTRPFFINEVIGVVVAGAIFGAIFAVTIGLILGLFSGGMTCIQHFSLRLILYQNGYIPWNYARFLNYCTERLFLQRVGGRYRFIHKMVQEHFADMEFN